MPATAASDSSLPRWQRSLLPAMLGADRADRGDAGASRLPRSLRDWLVDIVIFLGAVGIGVAGLASDHQSVSTAWFVIDIALGLPALAALWVRRRHPVAVGLITISLSAMSGLAGGAGIAGMFTVAVYCAPRRTLELFGLSIAAGALYPALYPRANGGYRVGDLLFTLFAVVIAVIFGAFVRARRQLVLSLQERNRRLEADQQRRVAEAQRAERNRIAREMHDVLAHRISLLSVHAGALEFHPDAAPAEIARAAGIIRESARAAQEELREVIGVLRAERVHDPFAAPDVPVARPQPTLDDLAELVAQSRQAGMDVRLGTALESGALPPTLGRTVYRLVQEALTNARKHAPGQRVSIVVAGDPRIGVRVSVTNEPATTPPDATRPPAASGAPGAHVGSGTGLIGLQERVALAGGRLEHAPLPGGGGLL